MKEPQVILVNEQDEPVGSMGKLEAHQKGVLHRAFSIFVLNKDNQLLLQQRALSKYHSPGLWTNSCCSHQQPGVDNSITLHNRLVNEMGFDCGLDFMFSFTYKHEFDNGLTEHELDHVYVGYYNGEVKPNPLEVMAYKWVNLQELTKMVEEMPESFTVWFKLVLDRFLKEL